MKEPRVRTGPLASVARSAVGVGLAALLLGACGTGGSGAPAETIADPAVSAALTAPLAVADRAGGVQPAEPAPAAKPTWTAYEGDGADLAAWVAARRSEAESAGRRTVVYVGAEWCEPCKRFHTAVDAGDLDGVFPSVTFLEFDRDLHGPALDRHGYASRLIPLFCVPDAAGKGTRHRIMGSVKGEGAVANLRPRLEQMLAGASEAPATSTP